MPLGPDSETVNTLLLDALDLFPVHVFNLTTDDLHMWPALSGSELEATSIISTNLIPPSGNSERLEKYAILEVALSEGVTKIGLLGLADPKKVRPNSGFRAVDIDKAVEDIKAEVMENADFLVVTGDLNFAETEMLARKHPEIYVVLQLQRRYILPRPRQVNNAVLLSSVERGRYLGRLELKLDAKGKVSSYEPEFIQLDENVPESTVMLEKVSEVRRRIY